MPHKNNAKLPIMLVDDEPEAINLLSSILRSKGYDNVITFTSPLKAYEYFKTREVAAIVLDLRMPGMNGKELLERISRRNPRVPAIVVTAENQIESAIDCMRLGAIDYIIKPISVSRLLSSISAALESHVLSIQINKAEKSADALPANCFNPILTKNKEMLAQMRYLEIVAKSNQPVLITGETGTGKELFAQSVHKLSGRNGLFVSVNVAGLDDMMIADTLFGHKKGAYTGATDVRDGLVKRAADGTLFLDEIGDLKESSQIKLLRLIQENEYYPLGADTHLANTARIVLATNRNLKLLLEEGKFRKDLYYRLFAHRIEIPPLRKRREDIPLLFDCFLNEAAASMGKNRLHYQSNVLDLLQNYDFPGNVRELQAVVLDSAARTAGDTVTAETVSRVIWQDKNCETRETSPVNMHHLPYAHEEPAVIFEKFPTLHEAEAELIQRALTIAGGKQGVAAQMLGITRQALNNRLIRRRD